MTQLFNIFSSTSVFLDLVVADHVTKWLSGGGVPPTITNITVLPKLDLNCKLKLVSNEDWEKKFRFFLALVWEKTQMRHDLPPLLSLNLCGSLLFDVTPFQFVFWSSLYFLLTLLFAVYSPFYICLLLFSLAFLSPFSPYFSVLSNFLARFSRLA